MISTADFYAHSFSDLWSTCSKNALVVQEPVLHIWSAKERRIKYKDNLACGRMERTTAITQRGKRNKNKNKKVRISNLGCLVSLAQMKTKQVKSWQYKDRRSCIKHPLVSAGVRTFCVWKLRKFSQNHTIMTKLSFTREERSELFLYCLYVHLSWTVRSFGSPGESTLRSSRTATLRQSPGKDLLSTRGL